MTVGESSLVRDAARLREPLVALRREVHRHPELGFEESGTANRVVEALESLAPSVRTRGVAKTGVVATLPSAGNDTPVVLLRACLDALPVYEQSEAEYASEVPGVCHACGHDGQVSMLVGAVALLAAAGPGATIHALFQPAEEIDAGARTAIEEGLLEDIGPDVVLGFHGHPGLPAGTIGVKTGAMMASISTIRCEVTGREGHGAEPHLATDAVTAAASLVLDWQVALSRRVDPRQPVVLSIGRLSSGVTPNVIPGRADIEGTLRSLDPTIEDELRRIISDVARGVEAQTGTSVSLSSDLVVPAVVNDPVVTSMVARATVKTLGEEAMVEATPTLGGDDFAWFLQRVPGCYLFVGEQQQGRGKYGWHDPSYDLDEDALVYGSAVLAAAALQAAQGRGQGPGGGSGETNSPTRRAST